MDTPIFNDDKVWDHVLNVASYISTNSPYSQIAEIFEEKIKEDNYSQMEGDKKRTSSKFS